MTDEANPNPQPASETPVTGGAAEASEAAAARLRAARARLVFGDPLAGRSADDGDEGWGERPASGGEDPDVARFLADKPPHHL